MNVPEVVLSNPLAWPEIRFRYLASTAKGRLPRQLSENENYKTSDVPYLSMEYLRGDENARYFVSPDCLLLAEASDILLLWDGSNAGEFLKAKCGAISSTMALVRPFKLANNYLFWLCKAVEPILKIFTNGMGIPHVDGKFLNNLCIPCALDSKVQYLIADYLDRETKRIDALVAEKERMLALLEEKRAALITHAVTRGLNPDVAHEPSGLDWLGNIPAHWEIMRLGFLVSLQGGSTPSTSKDDFWDGKIPWASPKDIKKSLLYDTIDHVTEAALFETGLSLIKPPVVLLVVRGMILAKAVPTSLTAVPMTINQDMKALRPLNNRIIPEYLKLLFDGLQAPLFMLIEESAHGTRCFRTDLLTNFKIPLPMPDEQQILLAQVGNADDKLKSLGETVRRSIGLLKERRAALITAAVTGQISVEEMTT